MTDMRKVICILGSGRCGTSAVTRSVSMLGVDIGSNFISRNKTNPKGFWEDEKIVALHKRMINEFASPKQIFPPNWTKGQRASQYKKIIINYLKENFAGSDIWALKDPRASLTVDLWKEIFAELNVEPHFLIMVRNPIDVVHSFQNSYGVSKNKALHQWKVRTLLALSKTYGERRILVDYDDLVGDSVGTLRRISDEFNLTWPEDEEKLLKNLNSFIDPNLQHSRSGLKTLLESKNYSDYIKNIYRLCIKASQSTTFLNSDEFNSKINAYLNSV